MNDRQQIVDQITEHLLKVVGSDDRAEIPENRDLREFPAFDSLGVLETLVWLESTFAVTIPDEELVVDHFDSIAKMANYVLAKSS